MSEAVEFKPRKRKNLRERKASSEDDDRDETLSKLEETKLAQKLRVKPNGVNIMGLAIGQKLSTEDIITKNDPFKLKSGGLISKQTLKSGKVTQVDDPYDVGVGTQFSAETNKRDEDEEMMKYIEEELRKRKMNSNSLKNGSGGDAESSNFEEKYLSPEETALLSLPDHLRVGSTNRSEEMLSNQMLNGIPEVDLGIDAKIRNIEATEEAKEKFLLAQKNKIDMPSHFVPTNIAVNFIQPNRSNPDEMEQRRRKQRQHEQRRSSNEKGKIQSGVKRATDDYHYDKFKKQFRRY